MKPMKSKIKTVVLLSALSLNFGQAKAIFSAGQVVAQAGLMYAPTCVWFGPAVVYGVGGTVAGVATVKAGEATNDLVRDDHSDGQKAALKVVGTGLVLVGGALITGGGSLAGTSHFEYTHLDQAPKGISALAVKWYEKNLEKLNNTLDRFADWANEEAEGLETTQIFEEAKKRFDAVIPETLRKDVYSILKEQVDAAANE